jgi:hypothetical protein
MKVIGTWTVLGVSISQMGFFANTPCNRVQEMIIHLEAW